MVLTTTKKVRRMSRFSETFDVPTLCKEVLERIKTPAETGKLYEVECIGFSKKSGFSMEFEFKTNEGTYITMKYNIDNNFDNFMNFITSLGVSYQTVESVKGNRYTVFYQDKWNMFVVKKLH